MMNELQQKSIRSRALIIMLFSGMIIFSNLLGALAFAIIGNGQDYMFSSAEYQKNPGLYLFRYYYDICFIFAITGILFFTGALFLRKLQSKGRIILSIVSIVLILEIWALSFLMQYALRDNASSKLILTIVFNGLLWSAPLIYLIRYVNSEAVIAALKK